jgi:hypothetical protein
VNTSALKCGFGFSESLDGPYGHLSPPGLDEYVLSLAHVRYKSLLMD